MSDAAKLIFFSHSRIMFHVFFLFFSAAIRHIAQSGIYFRRIIPAWLLPAFHNQSSCLPQSILQPSGINPPASHHQSYSLLQSILQSPTINPMASRHIISPLSYGFPSLCAVICHAVTPIPVITSLAIYALRSTKALPANMARACGNERETRPLSTAADIGCVSGSANASSPVSPIGTGWARHPVPMTCSSSTYGPVIQYLLLCSHISLTFWLLALQVFLSLIRCLLGLTG